MTGEWPEALGGGAATGRGHRHFKEDAWVWPQGEAGGRCWRCLGTFQTLISRDGNPTVPLLNSRLGLDSVVANRHELHCITDSGSRCRGHGDAGVALGAGGRGATPSSTDPVRSQRPKSQDCHQDVHCEA